MRHASAAWSWPRLDGHGGVTHRLCPSGRGRGPGGGQLDRKVPDLLAHLALHPLDARLSISDLAETFHMTLTGMRKHVGVLEQAEPVTRGKVDERKKRK